MKVSFATARRINFAIRGVAAVIAAVPVPFVVVVLLILGFWWGVDFTVSGILVVSSGSSYACSLDTR